MNKFLISLLLLAVSYTVYADDKDRVIDSLKTVIVNLEAENDSLSTELFRSRLEIISLKSNSDGLPYGTKKLSSPVPFENKRSARFEVFQSLDGYALAHAGEKRSYGWTFYGTIVVLVGTYYDRQIVDIKKPMIVGRYTYTSKNDMEHTVPVVQPSEQ